jgi:hypothetical protein
MHGRPIMKIRTAEDADRYRLALAPIDRAMFESEQKWGVGRIERLVSTNTLAAYKRGWDAYRTAIEDCDGPAIEAIAPKMIAALAYMDAEATQAGHQPLDVSTWECSMSDGSVLVVVRSQAEQSAVVRAANMADGGSAETTLPPDLAITIRQQHDGRRLEVWTLAEIVRLIERHGSLTDRPPMKGVKWEGTPAPSGVQHEEGMAADVVRSGFPMKETLAF